MSVFPEEKQKNYLIYIILSTNEETLIVLNAFLFIFYEKNSQIGQNRCMSFKNRWSYHFEKTRKNSLWKRQSFYWRSQVEMRNIDFIPEKFCFGQTTSENRLSTQNKITCILKLLLNLLLCIRILFFYLKRLKILCFIKN